MHWIIKRAWVATAAVLLCVCTAAAAEAPRQLPDGPAAVEALIEVLRQKAVITEGEAKEIRTLLDSKGLRMEAEKVVRIIPEQDQQQYMEMMTKDVARHINDNVKADVKQELKAEISTELKSDPDFLEQVTPKAPEWAKRIRFGGDIRLRYQADLFDENNTQFVSKPDDPTELMNTTEDRHRFRYRARVSAKAKVNDAVTAGLRLATGNDEDPVSTNDTLGDYLNKDTIVLDQAYIQWKAFPGATLWGGRMENPFFYTDLVWDSDVNLEGATAQWEHPFTDTLTGFVNGGAISIQEVEVSQDDKWMFAGQMGLQYKPRKDLTWKLGGAYYDYTNITGKRIDPANPDEEYDYTMPQFQQKGNLLMDIDPSEDFKMALASDYQLLNFTGSLEMAYYYPIYINFTADYVSNIGFDTDKAAENTGLDPDFIDSVTGDTGYQIGVLVGYPKPREQWEWNTSLFYKYLESDAVLDAFTDSDFHLGGTNAKGWILGSQLALAKNVWMQLRWLSTDEITGDPLSIDTLQVDLNATF